jgi:hypothetical protein
MHEALGSIPRMAKQQNDYLSLSPYFRLVLSPPDSFLQPLTGVSALAPSLIIDLLEPSRAEMNKTFSRHYCENAELYGQEDFTNFHGLRERIITTTMITKASRSGMEGWWSGSSGRTVAKKKKKGRIVLEFPKQYCMSQAPVAHNCNPSYSGGRDQEARVSKPAWANSS